ncbi:MAG: lipid-A-disaccharide synthase [Acidobacteriaceae bacterium]|nr:lipid-A-disaccharide synthase [Acidobacteriaceae bacterium]
MPTNSNPRIFLSAGEASGDHYGAGILAELRARLPEARFTGLGGAEMAAAGLERVVRAEDVAHMGFTEVVRHLPYVYAQYRKLVASIKNERPDVAVLIDFPEVNFRLARQLKRIGVPVLWFVSPQLWAWKRKRLRLVQQLVDRMMVIFPFESAFYRNRGVAAEFVGHPLAALPLPSVTREVYAAQHSLDPAKPWIALLPGSRQSEIEKNLPEMLQAAADLSQQRDCEFLLPVASTIDHGWLRRQFALGRRADDRRSGATNRCDEVLPRIVAVDDARTALFHSRASVVASGTATVQALTIGNPFVVVYRVSALTFALAKRLICYPVEIPAETDADGHLPIAMVNLIAGKRVVPELINQRFTAASLVAVLRPLLDETPARAQMIVDLAEARAKLRIAPDDSPLRRVSNAIIELLDGSL